jgi:hypothetical protein
MECEFLAPVCVPDRTGRVVIAPSPQQYMGNAYVIGFGVKQQKFSAELRGNNDPSN